MTQRHLQTLIAGCVLICCWPLSGQEPAASEPTTNSKSAVVPLTPAVSDPTPAEATNDAVPEVATTPNLLAERSLPANALVATAREKLALFQIDDSLFRKLHHGEWLSEEEFEILMEMLFRLPRYDLELMDSLRQPIPAWSELSEHPEQYVGGVYRVEGKLLSMVDLTPPPFDPNASTKPEQPAPLVEQSVNETLRRMAERKTIEKMFRCELDVAGLPHPVQVFVLNTPSTWAKQLPIGDRVALEGFFLKRGPADQAPAFYFVAPRLLWYPDKPLGKVNFDYGLLDTVQQKRTLLSIENEVFYQFLAAAKRLDAAAVTPKNAPPDQIVELWKNPAEHVGERYTFKGQSLHVSRIAIDDPKLIKRIGYDHYYYMEIIVPLKHPVKLVPEESLAAEEKRNAPAPKNAPPNYVLLDSMPMVFYFHELPPGETVKSLRDRGIEVTGYFLKSWRYQSNVKLPGHEHANLQGPLVMGRSPAVVVTTPIQADGSFIGIILLVVLAGGILVSMLLLWLQKRDRAQQLQHLPERVELPETLK